MPEQDEKTAIAATLEAYAEAIRNTDPNTMKKVFHPDAIISRHRPDGFVISVNPGELIGTYMQSAAPTSETSPNFSAEIISIQQAGDLAAAHMIERELEGKNFDTFFHLHKVDGQWVITSKATRGVAIKKS
ncbi:MAG: nuclear transport factor 2 family protein [Pigmentiphaga sp.]